VSFSALVLTILKLLLLVVVVVVVAVVVAVVVVVVVAVVVAVVVVVQYGRLGPWLTLHNMVDLENHTVEYIW